MHSLSDLAQSLNRSVVYVRGLMTRFDLPVIAGAGYAPPALAFLRTLLFLRVLNVAEETLRDLWVMEKKLLHLLHADSSGSPTWFLDACGQTGRVECRLLLSNYDLGGPLPAQSLQPELNFAPGTLPELFGGREMGEDALRILGDYLRCYSKIRSVVRPEATLLRAAAHWSARLK